MTTQNVSMTPQTVFSRANLWQSWLDVEAAMAQAQAEIGMIPQWAADEIGAKARLELFDIEVLERSLSATMAPIVTLVHALSDICGEAGRYVHWGGTTQNIMFTGRLLLVRQAHRGMLGALSRALDVLGLWAAQEADTLMAGRTNNRHALPITFGFKVAGWIEELQRQNHRFIGAEERVFALYFGGAIGAMHSFEGRGRDLSAALSRRLGFSQVLAPTRVSLDGQAEYIATLGLFAMSVGRIASELYRLMTEEIGEVGEKLGVDVIGSSTMPHKVNPKHVVPLISVAAQLRARVAPALEAGMPGFEGDAASNHLMAETLERACELGWELSLRLEETLSNIEIKADNMARNLGITQDFIASENLMMTLARTIGRSRAHDIVHHAVAETLGQKGSLIEILAQHPALGSVSRQEIETALSPTNYTGESAAIARQAAVLASEISASLRARVERYDGSVHGGRVEPQ